MASKRSHNAIGERSFRVVRKDTGFFDYFGPYGSLEGAQSKVDSLTEGYFELPAHLEIWIEQTPVGWERVDAA